MTSTSRAALIRMCRLIATDPDVVRGHGDISGPQVLADVRDYLELPRDETRGSAPGHERGDDRRRVQA